MILNVLKCDWRLFDRLAVASDKMGDLEWQDPVLEPPLRHLQPSDDPEGGPPGERPLGVRAELLHRWVGSTCIIHCVCNEPKW